MHTTLRLDFLPFVACLGLAAVTLSQQKPKTTPQVVKGTVQMAGDNGKANIAYTLGKTDPINITLTGARFSVVREVVGDRVAAPNRNEKLLVLDFIAHNPNSKIINFSGRSVKVTAVDQESVNREAIHGFTRAKTGEPYSVDMKPAQKVELRTVIVVPATGTVPKLILQHNSGGNVLRYDLKPILKPLTDPYVDTKDETGMTALATYDCKPDTYYPMENIDLQVVSGTLTEHGERFGPNTTSGGNIYVSVKFKLKGQAPQPAFLRFQGNFVDENGEKYQMLRLAQVSTDDHVSRRLGISEEYVVRMVGIVPGSAKLTKLVVTDTSGSAESRTYEFPVSKPALMFNHGLVNMFQQLWP